MAPAGRPGGDRVTHAGAPGEPADGAERLIAAPRSIHRPERLTGDDCVLRGLRASDVEPFAAAFREDGALGWLLGFERDPGEDYVRERLRSEKSRLRAGRSVAFAITAPEDESFAGEVLLHTFDWQHRRAALGIWVLPGRRRRGLGLCAVRAMCAYGFGELGLARIELTTFPDNAGMVVIAERAGFAAEGVLRSYTNERGRRCDVAMMSLLPGELR